MVEQLLKETRLKNIKLVAVSKHQDIQKIQQAVLADIHEFGENYLQEALPKIKFFKHNNTRHIIWHFIGRIQANKTKLMAQYFDWVQSVDQKNTALKLNQYRGEFSEKTENLKKLNICIQLNLSQKSGQAGILLEELPDFIDFLEKLPYLKFRGLMTLVTQDYEKTAKIFYDLKNQGYDIDTLSMGMSSDYQRAIAAGSTMLRLGTLIFGERKNK